MAEMMNPSRLEALKKKRPNPEPDVMEGEMPPAGVVAAAGESMDEVISELETMLESAEPDTQALIQQALDLLKQVKAPKEVMGEEKAKMNMGTEKGM